MKLRSVSGLTTTDKNANKISGLAAMSKEALETNLEKIEDRESRDHRRIGKKLELFTIDQTIGKGLPV
ncbi:MAG: hypothetical protein DRP42_00465 [Tenericutes bacterium]|nr:MAG: hypothetical protein DRP42_00465 [Mycoplasmatota bacterium]